MMIAEGKAANALGGKTARACDSCLKKRARWFCAADDAFLCQGCDTFVHSANQLASRHERIRLETSYCRSVDPKVDGQNVSPTWHQGFTRKARTPRNTKPALLMVKEKANSLPLVPEISGDEASHDESEEQILCRVPVLEPLPFASSTAELSNELTDEMLEKIKADDRVRQLNVLLNDDVDDHDLDIPVFIASDAELAEFAADVESLLGTGIDDDICKMEELKVAEKEKGGNNLDACFEDKRVKVEDQDDQEVRAVIACHFDPALDMARESLNWDFHFSSPLPGEEEEVKVTNDEMPFKHGESKEEERRRMLLKLNYETVITAWASRGSSPWADGTKPEFNSDDCWPDFMGTSPWELHHPFLGAGGGRIGGRDEEREARVLRYREKRRTRLFSKKIRYEVRKLNAERRPRMKGRFVKRTSFAGPSFPYLMKK